MGGYRWELIERQFRTVDVLGKVAIYCEGNATSPLFPLNPEQGHLCGKILLTIWQANMDYKFAIYNLVNCCLAIFSK